MVSTFVSCGFVLALLNKVIIKNTGGVFQFEKINVFFKY